MTWGSFLSRSISVVVVLPLLLTKLQPAEITLWYLFMSLIGLQGVVDAGFSPTFSRTMAYVMGGAGINELKSPKGAGSGKYNPHDLNLVYSTMRTIYFRLGLVWTLLLLTVGSLVLKKPIASVHDTGSAWLAWGVIVVVSCVSFQSEQYSSCLQGVNQIALLRRWETLTALGGILASFLVLILGGGLLELVIANQSWHLINVVRNRWLLLSVENGMMRSFGNEPFSKVVFDAVWPSAWRSGVGVLMSYGLILTSGVIYAQIGDTAKVASYLLGLRFIQIVSQFSQAPFYSKMPLYARLYAEGKKDKLLSLAQRAMRLSHVSYVAGFVFLGLVGGPLFKQIGSNASFPEPLLWSFMGIAFFIERFGAMHLQLYSTTNHIIWHVVTGVSGVVYLSVSLGLLGFIGAYAFPVGMITGYLSFYSWYSAVKSYKMFNIGMFNYEKSCTLAPAVCMIISVFIQLMM